MMFSDWNETNTNRNHLVIKKQMEFLLQGMQVS